MELISSKTDGEPIKSEQHLNSLVVRMLEKKGKGTSNSDSVVAEYLADIREVSDVPFPLFMHKLDFLATVS